MRVTSGTAPTTNSPSVRPLRWITAALALTQLAAPLVVTALAGNFLQTGATNQALITPAGYAFSVWGVITLLSAVIALAVLRFGLGSPWESSLLIDACLVFVGYSGWLAVAAQGWLWASVVVAAVMVGALIHILLLLVRRRDDLTCPSWLATLTTLGFGLYLGWLGAAIFANVAAALIGSGVSATGMWWQLVILVAAAAFAVMLTTLLRAPWGYLAGALWALVAITIGAAQRDSPVISVTAGAAALVVVAATVRVRRAQRP
ncbi:Uncharacterised protein [Mycolicibacterium vanbaalenii]|uniref:Uncharacterized protein n=1 Tax=Mycolicibacterium vanbaalenii TaxID=110539 RepID=A0A5S9RBM3_MYCVN|nr:hypothetical protein [Mycolicibacterium vanbaalenii]CAA0138367.1 Uncharacterised protein [Mycolicibacterium vanbaalenii]